MCQNADPMKQRGKEEKKLRDELESGMKTAKRNRKEKLLFDV
jgi:hypothetical protein